VHAKAADVTNVPVIAIDGPAGVGKSTTARRVAAALGYYFLSSGMIYRAMALHLLRGGWDGQAAPDPASVARLQLRVDARGDVWMNGEDVTASLGAEPVSQAASVMSTVPAIRDRSNAVQRETVAAIGRERTFPGVVLEGRDIGTVVFPDARHKFFLTARPEVRAERRYREVAAKQPSASRGAVLAAIQERDARDSTRAVAPLVAATDAQVVDTSDRTLDEVVQHLLREVQSPH
jgi:cytidylate kinase